MATPRSSGGNGLLWEKKLDPGEMYWARIGHAQRAVALAALDLPGGGGRLFCATWDNTLWCRDLAGSDAPWRPLGGVRGAAALAAVNVPGAGPQLFCATRDNWVYRRDALAQDAPWQPAGEAADVVALAALELPGEGAKLICATGDGLLYQRDAAAAAATWQYVYGAEGVRGLAAADLPGAGPQLFCATRDNRLFRRGVASQAAGWERVGGAQDVIAMAAVKDRLLCVTLGEEAKLPPVPHQVFLPVRKPVQLTAGVRSEEARRVTVTDGFGTCLGCWAGAGDQRLGETEFCADQGTTPGVLVVEVLWERQYGGDPTWYGSRCTVSHRRGGRGAPEELTVAGDDCWVTFRWSR
jgi:hypothetical protein